MKKAELNAWKTDASGNFIDASNKPVSFDQYGDLNGLSYQFGGPTRYAILDTRNTDSHPYGTNLKYYDHFKQVFQTGNTYNNIIDISGAGDRFDFNISAANNHTL